MLLSKSLFIIIAVIIGVIIIISFIHIMELVLSF